MGNKVVHLPLHKKKKRHFPQTQSGFTLVEVLVSMFIMSFLTIIVSTSIRTAVQNKQKIEARMKYQNMLYDGLRIMKMDIEKAFNYQDVFYEIEKIAIQELEDEKNKKNPNAEPGADSPPPPPIKLTHFLGEESSVHFTSTNHFRTKYNAQESDQMEVGYYLDSCKVRGGKKTTKCLWRRNSVAVDDKVDKGGDKVVVAEYIKKFKLSYKGGGERDEWISQWRSDNKGRPIQRNKFPHFVKVEMEIHDKDNKKANKMSQDLVVNIHFPNNEPYIAPKKQTADNEEGGGP